MENRNATCWSNQTPGSADSSACWNQAPTYRDIEAITIEMSGSPTHAKAVVVFFLGPSPCNFFPEGRGGHLSPSQPTGQQPSKKTLWNRATCKLETNEDHHSTLFDEICLMVPSTASFMHSLDTVYKVQNTSWNRSNRELQTNEDHHSKLLDEIWLMVPSTALCILQTKLVKTKNVMKLVKS